MGTIVLPKIKLVKKRKIKTLQELCEGVVASNFRVEMYKDLNKDLVENLQKRMSQWRQVKYFRSYKQWYPKGNLSWIESFDSDGVKDGPCIQWYENGQVKLER